MISQSPILLTELSNGLAPAAIDALTPCLVERELAPAQILVTQGEAAELLFAVIHGRLEVQSQTGETIGWVGAGEVVGEIAFLEGGTRHATIVAETQCALISLSRADFERVSAEHPELRTVLARVSEIRSRMYGGYKSRPSQNELVSVIAQQPFFEGIANDKLIELEPFLQWLNVPSGDTLMCQGDSPDGLYMIVSGRVSIEQTDHHGHPHHIAECSRGDYLGELGLLTQRPCAATARAKRDCAVLRLPRLTFDRIIEQYPRLCLQLARTTATRIQENLGAIPKPSPEKTIAVIGLSEGIDLQPLCDALRKTMGVSRSIRIAGSAELDAQHGKGFSQVEQGDARHSEVISVLSRLESEASFVLLRADSSGLTPWTQRCLRQADEVLFVARASDSPTQSALEARVLELLHQHSSPRLRLALMHAPEISSPSGTAAWTAQRPGILIHHVRDAHLPDIERMARNLTGTSIGVALSGGGARGFAHIGILRALSEAGIEPDIIGGTSMGAVIGAQLAMGMSHDDMIRVNRRSWVDAKPWSDYTLPFSSVISGRRLARMLRDMLGDRHIEDLWLRYFCVSSNLTRAKAAEHHHGLLHRWVLATASVPGLAPPVFHEGEVYVDGGVANNLPGDVVRRLSAGTVIAIDTSSVNALAVDPELTSCPTGRAMLKHRFSGKPDAPSLYEILFRSTDIASEKTIDRVRKDADLYLRPPLEGVSNGHFDRIEKIVEEGYRYGLEEVARFSSTVHQQNQYDNQS